MPTTIWALDGTPVFDETYYHWRMDEGSGTSMVEDIASKDMTHNGTYATGVGGNTAVYFNGINDRAYLSDSMFNHDVNPFTFSWWMQADFSPGVWEEFVIVSKYDSTNTFPGYGVHVIRQTVPYVATIVTVYHGVDASNYNSETVELLNVAWDSNTWRHFCASYDPGTAVLKVWIDGRYVGDSAGGTADYDADNAFTTYQAYAADSGYYYEYTVDDLWMIKNKVLTDAEAMALYKYRA